MLFTNSFYRYINISYMKINIRVHVRTFTHISSRREAGSTEILPDIALAQQLLFYGNQLRSYASSKKKTRIKKLFQNIGHTKQYRSMDESMRPTLNHVCYGGKFEISSTLDGSDDEKRNDKVGGARNSREPSHIPADFRVWESVGSKSNSGMFRFTVVSYNVLAQCLLEFHPYLYRGCSPANLKWKVRGARLYDEILSLDPDILCLQEVQASHISEFYSKFEQKGYFGVYKRKTGCKYDGCAIYFKKSLFDIQDEVSIEFYQPQIPILNRDNIGIMIKLVPRASPGTPLVVATTHLLYNPKRTDVRLAQVQVMLAELDRFAYYNNGQESGHYPIIVTGDFNSQPDSAVIQLMDRGRVSTSTLLGHSDWHKIGITDNCQHLTAYLNRQNAQTTDFSMTKIYNSDYSNSYPNTCTEVSDDGVYNTLFNSGVVGHSLPLVSVYDRFKEDGTNEATTFQDYWVTVDYIYFSAHGLRLIDRLRLPTSTECTVLDALPNHVYASDHLVLAAVFELNVKSTL